MAVERSIGASVADRIREARRACGWSQSQLAIKAGVSRPTIARIEGGRHVRMGTLEAVMRTLGLDVVIQASERS
jgi:transcriptional regulator with XRE-family HTH domain